MNPSPSQTALTQGLTESAEPKEEEKPRLILRLRPRRRITWTEDTIDNEHMNKKSSKRCCIFHKARDFGESSTESDDSDDSDDSDSDCDDPNCRKRRKRPKKRAPAEPKNDENNNAPKNNIAPGAGWSKPKKIPDYQRYHA